MKKYRRSGDVVETSKLGFLSDGSKSAKEFMDAALKEDSWKKPMDTPLSFIFILPFRTAQDWFRINYVRLHDRSLDLEVDQLCPAGAPELKDPALAVIEIPLGPMKPGSFHYLTWLNPGTYDRAPPEHPEGWEYADTSSLAAGGTSGCTIVDPKTNDIPRQEQPPVRKAEYLTEAQLDQGLERLRHASFPMAKDQVYELVGLSKEQRERPSLFGFAEGTAFVVHRLTESPTVHLFELRGEKGDPDMKGRISAALIYYRDGERTYTLYDSRVEIRLGWALHLAIPSWGNWSAGSSPGLPPWCWCSGAPCRRNFDPDRDSDRESTPCLFALLTRKERISKIALIGIPLLVLILAGVFTYRHRQFEKLTQIQFATAEAARQEELGRPAKILLQLVEEARSMGEVGNSFLQGAIWTRLADRIEAFRNKHPDVEPDKLAQALEDARKRAIAGTYASEHSSGDYFELRPDGSLTAHQHGQTASGRYRIEGSSITIEFPEFAGLEDSEAELINGEIISPTGERWLRRENDVIPPTPPAASRGAPDSRVEPDKAGGGPTPPADLQDET